MKIKHLALVISALVFTSISLNSAAEGGYFGGQVTKTTIDTAVSGLVSVELEPNNIIFMAGADFNKYFALEGRFGFSLGDDSINGVSLEVSRLIGAYAKFSVGNKVSPYVIAGFTDLELDSNVASSDSDNDTSYGFGVDISLSEQASLNLEYMNYYEDSAAGVSVDITAIAVGLKYIF